MKVQLEREVVLSVPDRLPGITDLLPLDTLFREEDLNDPAHSYLSESAREAARALLQRYDFYGSIKLSVDQYGELSALALPNRALEPNDVFQGISLDTVPDITKTFFSPDICRRIGDLERPRAKELLFSTLSEYADTGERHERYTREYWEVDLPRMVRYLILQDLRPLVLEAWREQDLVADMATAQALNSLIIDAISVGPTMNLCTQVSNALKRKIDESPLLISSSSSAVVISNRPSPPLRWNQSVYYNHDFVLVKYCSDGTEVHTSLFIIDGTYLQFINPNEQMSLPRLMVVNFRSIEELNQGLSQHGIPAELHTLWNNNEKISTALREMKVLDRRQTEWEERKITIFDYRHRERPYF